MTGTEISKWADSSMFAAEASDNTAPSTAYLLGAPVDPLGQIAAAAKMYKGEVVRDLADVTDAERQDYLEQISKTVLAMPLETVHLHFMIDNVHRGITHQLVRQRTAAYAQESMRFAVKEDLTSAIAYPPSLADTVPGEVLADRLMLEHKRLGLPTDQTDFKVLAWDKARGAQKARLRWDKAVAEVASAYKGMIEDDGIAAEDARGLVPTNVLTRLNYITNLRSFYDTLSVRVSDQAQFEWRQLAMAYVVAMRQYGESVSYKVWADARLGHPDGVLGERTDPNTGHEQILVRRSSAWQYKALTEQIRPVEFKTNGIAFGANFDRPSRIAERVRAFAAMGVRSDRWLQGAPEHNIPPLRPEEWLLDPNSARLNANQEFDIWGNRVTKDTGSHWRGGYIYNQDNVRLDWTGAPC